MSREILFRAWYNNKELLEVATIFFHDGKPSVYLKRGKEVFGQGKCEVVLEQFTGASEGNKKLFERDLVRVDGDITGVVLYDSGAFIIATNDVSDGYVLLSDYVDSEGVFYGEILGNIHDKEQASEQRI